MLFIIFTLHAQFQFHILPLVDLHMYYELSILTIFLDQAQLKADSAFLPEVKISGHPNYDQNLAKMDLIW